MSVCQLSFLLPPQHIIQRTLAFERTRLLEAASDAVPQREVLSVVVVVVDVVVRVMRRAVHDWTQALGHTEIAVMDGDGPDVDGDVEEEVGVLVHGEQEHVDVVRAALQEAVQRVEGVTGEWSGNLGKKSKKFSFNILMQQKRIEWARMS